MEPNFLLFCNLYCQFYLEKGEGKIKWRTECQIICPIILYHFSSHLRVVQNLKLKDCIICHIHKGADMKLSLFS